MMVNFNLGTCSAAFQSMFAQFSLVTTSEALQIKHISDITKHCFKMPSITEQVPNIISTTVTEVPVGEVAVLNCSSNDDYHNFMFWLLNNNKVVGPYGSYDDKKYKFKVLSGTLHINSVSPHESGYYKCLSSKVNDSAITIGEVEMIVKSSFSALEAAKFIAILISIAVIIICAIKYYRLRKEWKQYKGRKVVPGDDADDDQDELEEIYNRTTTSINQAVAGPSRNPSSEQLLYGIDNQGLDTDFSSVFENIQIKSPQTSLI